MTRILPRIKGIPDYIQDNHTKATICMCCMYANGNTCFTSISRYLQFCTIASVTSRSRATILHETKAVITCTQVVVFMSKTYMQIENSNA